MVQSKGRVTSHKLTKSLLLTLPGRFPDSHDIRWSTEGRVYTLEMGAGHSPKMTSFS